MDSYIILLFFSKNLGGAHSAVRYFIMGNLYTLYTDLNVLLTGTSTKNDGTELYRLLGPDAKMI